MDYSQIARAMMAKGRPDLAPRQAELSTYEPTWKDRIATAMLGDEPTPLRKDMTQKVMGSAGAGTSGFGLVDLTPAGAVLGAQEAARSGDYQGAAVAMMPAGGNMGRAAKGAAKAEAPAAKSIFDLSLMDKQPQVPQMDLPRYTPPRGVPQRVLDVTGDRGVRDKMLGVIEEGVNKGGANWYNAEPLRVEFNRTLGKDQGDQQFRRYMDYVAATSPRSEVGANARNASYYYMRDVSGQGMPAVGDKNPQPYGHMAQRLHQMNANRVHTEGWDPLNNPKPASFVENLVGNQAPVTVDTHAFRLPAMLAQDPRFLETAYQSAKDAPKQNIQKMVASGEMPIDDATKTAAYWQAQPKENEYGAMEQFYKQLGKDTGLTPAQVQAAAWTGGGKITGLASDSTKPFIGFFEDRVNLTAQKLGMDPQEVLQRFIRGQMPLLSVGGAAGATALGAAQDQQQ